MTDLPKVSIAIITYNQEDFIKETLDSVISQDYPNLEIVVSDDGSTDRTPEIIRDYAKKYPELFKILLSDRNRGIAENCNSALFACTGEYIAWLGGDDLFYQHKIRLQVEVMMIDTKCNLCYHAVKVFRSTSDQTIAITNLRDRKRRNLKQLLHDGISLPGSAVMVRRSSCPTNGFDVNIPNANDWLFFVETMADGYIVRAEGVLGGYRMHDKNITNSSLVEDMHKTFDKIRCLRPELKYFADRAEAVAYFHEGRKSLSQGQRVGGRALFIGGLKLYPLYSPLWLWLLLSNIDEDKFNSLRSIYRNLTKITLTGRRSRD